MTFIFFIKSHNNKQINILLMFYLLIYSENNFDDFVDILLIKLS